jgi:hypothetical protein
MHRQTERQTDSAKLQDDRKTNKQMYRYTNVPTYIPSVLKTETYRQRDRSSILLCSVVQTRPDAAQAPLV